MICNINSSKTTKFNMIWNNIIWDIIWRLSCIIFLLFIIFTFKYSCRVIPDCSKNDDLNRKWKAEHRGPGEHSSSDVEEYSS